MGLAKVFVVAGWVLGIASFFLPSGASLVWAGRCLFWFLLIAHTAECLIFLPVLRRAGGSLAEHLGKTMVFGVFHVREVRS